MGPSPCDLVQGFNGAGSRRPDQRFSVSRLSQTMTQSTDRVDLLVSQKRRTMIEQERSKRNTRVPPSVLMSSKVRASTNKL